MAVSRNPVNRGAVNTPRARNVYDRAEEILDRLDAGDLDAKQAQVRVNTLRAMNAHIRTELEHATRTNRLTEGNPELPGFVRTAPKFSRPV